MYNRLIYSTILLLLYITIYYLLLLCCVAPLPLRRPAALSGPVADEGLRMWVYQAQAYERTGHLESRWCLFPRKTNDKQSVLFLALRLVPKGFGP